MATEIKNNGRTTITLPPQLKGGFLEPGKTVIVPADMADVQMIIRRQPELSCQVAPEPKRPKNAPNITRED